MSPTRLRVEVPRSKLLGIHFTRRGVFVSVVLCIATIAIAIPLDLEFLVAFAGATLMVVLLMSYLAWMAYLTWSRGAQAFSVCDEALLVTLENEITVLRHEDTTAFNRVGHMFLQIQNGGESYQYTILHVPPTQVEALFAQVRARLNHDTTDSLPQCVEALEAEP